LRDISATWLHLQLTSVQRNLRFAASKADMTSDTSPIAIRLAISAKEIDLDQSDPKKLNWIKRRCEA
jgi:hypothetical protein